VKSPGNHTVITLDDHVVMTNRERRASRAAWLAHRDMVKAGDDLRQSRLRSGLTLEEVGRAIGVSAATVWRAERGIRPGPRPEALAKHADAVGLRARVLLLPRMIPFTTRRRSA
jgi:DNA-binding XRE family transcriptional regulator